MKKQAKRAINSTRSSGRAICRQKSGPRVGGRKHGRDQYFTRKRGKTSRRGGQVPMTTTNLVKDKTSQKGAGASRPTSVLDSCLSPWSSSHHCAFDWPNIQISRPVARAQRPGADGVSPSPTAEFPPPQAQKERPRATIKAEMLQSGPSDEKVAADAATLCPRLSGERGAWGRSLVTCLSRGGISVLWAL